jgi:hypothetical protein
VLWVADEVCMFFMSERFVEDVVKEGRMHNNDNTVLEDEGYTSPSEEDFKYNPITSPVSTRFSVPKGLNLLLKSRSYNNANNNSSSLWNPSSSCSVGSFLLPGQSSLLVGIGSAEFVKEEARAEDDGAIPVPWEEIARIPYIPERHLTWDKMEAPVPYRFLPSHSLLHRKHLQKKLGDDDVKPFVLDSTGRSNKFIECFWKGSTLTQEEGGLGVVGDGNNTRLRLGLVTELKKQCLEKPLYIPLRQFLQHAFHLLSGRESRTFVIEKGENNNDQQQGLKKKEGFKKNPVVLLSGISPTALWRYCQPLIKCGSIVKRLNRYATLHYDNKLLKEEGLDGSAVMVACLRYISNYLKMYQTVLMLNSSSVSGLVDLACFIKVSMNYVGPCHLYSLVNCVLN